MSEHPEMTGRAWATPNVSIVHFGNPGVQFTKEAPNNRMPIALPVQR